MKSKKIKDPTFAYELLTELVAIPSFSGEESAAVTYLVNWLNAHGFTAQVDEAGNAVGVKGNGAKEILLLGHIDTFGGQVPIKCEDMNLYGRGSVDAKGPLCTFAVASSLVDVASDWRITVVGAVEEECATSKGARHILDFRLADHPKSKITYTYSTSSASQNHLQCEPKFCIIGEPSQWDRITLGYKGRLLMDVVLRAPFSHSAGEGRLPAEQAVDFWQAVEHFCTEVNHERKATTPFHRLIPSLRQIVSHDEGAFGVVEMNIGFRLPVEITPTNLIERLGQLTATLSDTLWGTSGTTAEFEFSGAETAYKGSKSNPLVREFLAAIRENDGEPRFVFKTGTCDMNVVGPHWPNTPIVAYGPGDSSLDHTPNEHISLSQYWQAIDVLQEVLENLMG